MYVYKAEYVNYETEKSEYETIKLDENCIPYEYMTIDGERVGETRFMWHIAVQKAISREHGRGFMSIELVCC